MNNPNSVYFTESKNTVSNSMAISKNETELKQHSNSRIKASPLARKLAKELELDLTTIEGSGPGGRIVKRDLNQEGSGSPINNTSIEVTSNVIRSLKPAESISGSSRVAATSCRIDLDDAIKLIANLQDKAAYEAITFDHLLLKATAYAISNLNCVSVLNKITFVSASEQTTDVLVYQDIASHTLRELINEEESLSEQSSYAGLNMQQGALPDLSKVDSSLVVYNLGALNLESMVPSLRNKQKLALALGGLSEMPVVKDGQVQIGFQLNATLSFDTTHINELTGASFLNTFKEALETPALLMV